MESPLWKMKPEPASPLYLYEDAVLLDDGSNSDDFSAFKLHSTIVKKEQHLENKADVYSKLLEDLDHLDQLEDFIKEEPFSNWLEEKVELPIFEDIAIEPARINASVAIPRFKNEDLKSISQPIIQLQPIQQIPQDTNFLLQEFETVFGAVELNHGQLTPPQSPPLTPPQTNPQQLVLTPLTPINFQTNRIPACLQQNLPVYYQPEQNPGTPQPDVAHELAVVEELVRTRAENLFSENWEQPGPSSPSSVSCSSFSEYSSDPEWIPDSVQSTSSNSNPLVERPTKGRKRAGKPYSRNGLEDKKSRKKEQNKNAATRYRLKKKAEIEVILTEERGLIDVRTELQTKVSDLQREIKCLKGLMRDLFKAKGIIQ